MKYTSFIYNDNSYNFCYNEKDPSGMGCIYEIVNRDEYKLGKFTNLETSIIDIGANCGVASIILAKQNPKSKILAYEPHLPTFKLLEENIRINSLQNITIYNLAVSNESGKEIKLCVHPDYSGGNTTCSDEETFIGHFNNKENISFLSVKTISLDDIIKYHSIDQVNLLKIDCEGAEYEIIYESNFIRERKVKNIVGEFHNLKYNNKAENQSSKLYDYCNKYIEGEKIITFLTI